MMMISLRGLMKLVPKKAIAIRGIRTRAPKYPPRVPRREKVLFPRNRKEKGITATAGGTAAMRIKPVRKSLSVIKYRLSRMMTPLSTR